MRDITKSVWWEYVSHDIQELLEESLVLLDTVKSWNLTFHDYSFVVFPAAKAYEGFLKKLFLDMKLISSDDYYGKHFRIGKSLNPQLEKRLRNDDWVYAKLAEYCGGKELPDFLWNTWKQSRNMVFHWFPNEANAITKEEAKDRVNMIIQAFDRAFESCRVQ